METSPAKAAFTDELGRVLSRLYDPDVLRRSPLIRLFGLDHHQDPTEALQHIVSHAIESLKPNPSVPPHSNAWRFYQILYSRFVEQFTQAEVAEDLALSVRQLRRQEAVAQQILADHLWARYDLEQEAAERESASGEDVLPAGEPAGRGRDQAPDHEAELEWLARTIPSEPADVREIVEQALKTVTPLLQTEGVSASLDLGEALPPLAVQVTAARQALLNLLAIAGRCAPGGSVAIHASMPAGQGCVRLEITARRGLGGEPAAVTGDELALARRLTAIAGGTLEAGLAAAGQKVFIAVLTLPIAEDTPVLVIDDNTDTLKLIQRYLADTPYHYVGTADATTALSLAERMVPRAVILDVMLPGIDGWDLLGRLREHPQTCQVPVIVSTILPQEQLALTLGAAEFLRKPISREALLAALRRQIRLTESPSLP